MLNFLSNPSVLISYVIILLTAFPVHEFAHAWVADRFGDDTPRVNGRLTLNPFAHLDPIGTIMMIIAGFGWAKPVPIDPYALQSTFVSGTHAGLPGWAHVKFSNGDFSCHPFPVGVGLSL